MKNKITALIFDQHQVLPGICLLLFCTLFSFIAEATPHNADLNARNSNYRLLSNDDLQVYSYTNEDGEVIITIELSEEADGKISLKPFFPSLDCFPRLSKVQELGNSYSISSINFEEQCSDLILIPEQLYSHEIRLVLPTIPISGLWKLVIPEDLIEIQPNFIETESIPFTEDELKELKIPGAWHIKGSDWSGRAMFTIHDDDAMDGTIPSSIPAEYMTTGYFSILYPVLESLGLRGCVSLEGRRAGWHNNKCNDNAKILKRLQNEYGWEIQSHSMECLGETLNNWWVNGLESDLAKELLLNGNFYGLNRPGTVSIYDTQTNKQYTLLEDRSGWIESDILKIKPYIGNYETGKSVMYNPQFSVDYHWGEWFRKAKKYGIKGKSWVTHNTSSSHANVPLINSICPNGFADMVDPIINYPPLLSTATRMMLEGQIIPGYKGENDPDNTFNQEHYDFFKTHIEEAAETGGWLVMGLHAYRRCWKNYLPGALVSEGGDYPDEWVDPMEGIDPMEDALTPPERLGIRDWSEWYPCPGTRLDMIWRLLKYSRDLGMINVTSSEGFDKMGNKIAVGYYNRGKKIGQDIPGLFDTREFYPHYIVGANDEVSYYNPYSNDLIVKNIIIGYKEEADIETAIKFIDTNEEEFHIFDITGIELKEVPQKGIYILTNGIRSYKVIK